MAVKGMHLAWITVSDLQKAKKFFTEKLGLKVSTSAEEYGWIELVGPQGGSLLGLAQAQGTGDEILPGHNAVITMTVDNLEQTKAEMVKKGVKLIGDTLEVPHIVRLQLIQDEDGNHLQLVEELANH